MHAGIHVIEKQQSIELYYHAGIHVIETGAKVVFAAVLGSIPVPCLLYTSPSPRDLSTSRMPSSA